MNFTLHALAFFLININFVLGEDDVCEEIKASVKIADKDGDGKLSASEIKGLMVAIGEDMDDENAEVDMFISVADADGDKMLNYEEIIGMLCEKEEPHEKKQMKAMFKMYDADSNGKLTKQELVQLMKMMAADDEEVEELGMLVQMMMKMADENEDGELSFEEFSKMMS